MGRFRKEKLLKTLKDRADVAAKTGAEISKKAGEKGRQSIEAARKAAVSSDKNLEILRKLSELKAEGIIDEKEYKAKKKEILDRI